MSKTSIRLAGCAVALAVIVPASAAAAAASATAGSGTSQRHARIAQPAAVPGTALWAARYTSQGRHRDSAVSVTVSPRGGAVFVTGTSTRASSGTDFLTLAYSAATGQKLWSARYSSPGTRPDTAAAVATGPGGQRVFVTGQSAGDFATVAYRASTGKRLWVQRYRGPGGGTDTPASLAVSPSGSELIVTGTAGTRGSRIDTSLVTIAYSVATGERLWIQRFDGPAGGGATAGSLAISPAGSRVYVTGYATLAGWKRSDLVTMGYSSATGRRLWLTRSSSRCGNYGGAITVSPGGQRVFVAGTSGYCPDIGTYLTAAYAADTGKTLWIRRYMGHARTAAATAIAVSPGGQRVYVTGSGDQGFAEGAMTLAYSASAGTRLWAARYGGDAFTAHGNAVTVSPDARTVYLAGASDEASGRLDYVAIAYSASTGAQLWRASSGGPDNLSDSVSAMALSPDGRTVFITGTSLGKTTLEDFLTIAYRT